MAMKDDIWQGFIAISKTNLNRKYNALISKQEGGGGLQSTFLSHGSGFSFDFLPGPNYP